MSSSTDAGSGARSRESDSPGLDDDAFDTIVHEHSGRLYSFALSLTRDPHAAADLTQETFARAFERRDQFRGESSPATWLRRIMHNLAVDTFRRRDDESLVERIEGYWAEPAYSVDAAQIIERAETAEQVRDALARLPFIYRAVLVLHDVEGFTMREVAEIQQIELPAAKQRLRRGRMMLVSAFDNFEARRLATEKVPLNCWDARQLVSEYMNDDLSRDEAASVEAHLEGCPTCPPLYAALVGVNDALGQLRDPDTVVPPDLTRRIQALISP